MYMQTISGRYKLLARAPSQDKATIRDVDDDEGRLIAEGERLARASTADGGVLSAWIVDTRTGKTTWSVGEAAEPQPEEE